MVGIEPSNLLTIFQEFISSPRNIPTPTNPQFTPPITKSHLAIWERLHLEPLHAQFELQHIFFVTN